MHLPQRRSGESGREYALRAIRESIVNLEFLPGSRISESALAAQLGVSRTPVGEALNELSRVRIVEIYPQRQSIVSYIDCDLVEEARFIREVLECAIVRHICTRKLEKSDFSKLTEILRLQQFYLRSDAPQRLLELDNQFHEMLFDLDHKPQAYSMMKNTSIHFERVRSLSLTTIRDQNIVQDHEEILDALQQGREELAAACMKAHLRRYRVDEKTIQAKYPEYFRMPGDRQRGG